MFKTSLTILLMLSFGIFVGCSSFPKPLSDQERTTIKNSGGKTDLLDDMLTYQNNEKIDATLIFKDGQLVLERYANGYDGESLHDIRSATKAITSLLVGIAIDKGFIENEDQSIIDFFPEQRIRRPLFQEIRIKDLLTMSSGLDSDDWIPSSIGNEEKMYDSRSWIDFSFLCLLLTNQELIFAIQLPVSFY